MTKSNRFVYRIADIRGRARFCRSCPSARSDEPAGRKRGNHGATHQRARTGGGNATERTIDGADRPTAAARARDGREPL